MTEKLKFLVLLYLYPLNRSIFKRFSNIFCLSPVFQGHWIPFCRNNSTKRNNSSYKSIYVHENQKFEFFDHLKWAYFDSVSNFFFKFSPWSFIKHHFWLILLNIFFKKKNSKFSKKILIFDWNFQAVNDKCTTRYWYHE